MKLDRSLLSVLASLALALAITPHVLADPLEIDDLPAEQAKEKRMLEEMKQELGGVKGELNDAMKSMSQLTDLANRRAAAIGQVHEFHLFAKAAEVDFGGGVKAVLPTYNGKIPGPEIHIREGELVKIVLHNELGEPTSLHMHGLALPHNVDGLPRAGKPATSKDAGDAVKPERYLRAKESFAYQFIAPAQTTAYYHPQVMHSTQRDNGMYGAIIVHPRLPSKAPDQELTLFFGKHQDKETTYLVNGKTAPAIPAIELKLGTRVRLHLFNLTGEAVPLHLSGHRFEVVAENGSDPLEPHVFRDTITLNPADRLDLDFIADNPGVWSLSSEKTEQISQGGKFPRGIAVVVRYKN